MAAKIATVRSMGKNGREIEQQYTEGLKQKMCMQEDILYLQLLWTPPKGTDMWPRATILL